MQYSSHSPTFYPAKLLEYNAKERTAQVEMKGLTDGLPKGIKAMLAYPIGDDDLDTERLLVKGADVWVFFEQGDTTKPIIAFYRRHGKKKAVVGTRRIRQETIELLAKEMIKFISENDIYIKAQKITIDSDIEHNGNMKQDGNTNRNGSLTQSGNMTVKGRIKATIDIIAGAISTKFHKHLGNKYKPTSKPL